MPAVVETWKLTKFYGRHAGLRDLDLRVEEGEVFGLLGPNGAGKTTTIRLLLDFIKCTGGRATVFGLPTTSASREIRRRTGYLAGDFTAYPNLTAGEVFDYFMHLRGNTPAPGLDELTDRFKLDHSRKFGELSRGNRQKVGLVQAYMGSPEMVILDEPTSGLDPFLQIEFRKLVLERKRSGITQFISSHLLPEVEAVCDRVGIIREGRLVAVETMVAMRARAVAKATLVIENGAAAEAAAAFAQIDGVDVTEVAGDKITLRAAGEVDSVIKAAARFTVGSFEIRPPALDEVFMAHFNSDVAEECGSDSCGKYTEQ